MPFPHLKVNETGLVFHVVWTSPCWPATTIVVVVHVGFRLANDVALSATDRDALETLSYSDQVLYSNNIATCLQYIERYSAQLFRPNMFPDRRGI